MQAIATYLREVATTPLLDADGERYAAWWRDRGDRRAVDTLVTANLRLVVSIAKRYVRRGLDLDDLIQSGNIGLMEAAKRFNVERGVRFSTYATPWILLEIRRNLMDCSTTIRIPRYLRELCAAWCAARAEMTDDLGRAPSDDEIAARLGIGRQKMTSIIRALTTGTVGQVNPDTDALSTIADHTAAPDSEMLAAEERDTLRSALHGLDSREQSVLTERFPADGEPFTLKAIGERLGLTRERVRQIETEAIGKIRRAVA